MRAVLIAVVALAACTGRSPAQGAAAGEQVFKRLCSPCHEIGREAKVKLGPPLNGIESSTLKLPTYIHAPMQKVPGTKMAFVGMKNDKDIADLWAYLKQFGPDGQKKWSEVVQPWSRMARVFKHMPDGAEQVGPGLQAPVR